MATKVTLSSPPVQHQLLQNQPPLDVHHHRHEQQQQLNHHYGQTENSLSGYTPKRQPTPPKPKHSVPSWKQHRHSSKTKDMNNTNDQYPDSPNPTQSATATTANNTNNQKKTPTMGRSSSAYDYDHQQYLYHQQALKAEGNKQGNIQQPPPSLKKHKDQLTELFMVQEQLDQTSRERDRILEENTQLKYHLHVLHVRMQNVEYMWQNYNAAAAAATQTWEDNNSKRQQQQQRYPYSYDPFGPPSQSLDFASLSHRSLPEQRRPDDGFRHQRFRRHRSKSLPRATSLPDNNDTPYSLQQPMMFPPPSMFSSMMNKLPMPPPPPPQMFDRPPPPFGPRMHNDPLLDTNNNMMNGDDDSGSDDMDEMDGLGSMRQRRRQMYHDGNMMTDGTLRPPLPMFPFPPPPSASFYPTFRNHQNNNSRGLPMGAPPPPSFGHHQQPRPSYYADDDKDDEWDQRSMIPPALERPPNDYGTRPSRFNMYARDEWMENGNHQQPWINSDPRPGSKQSTFYGDPLQQQQQQQQQQAFYSPRHRRAQPHGPRSG
ncbi:unnamed protein product [Absidia cylindrospora]